MVGYLLENEMNQKIWQRRQTNRGKKGERRNKKRRQGPRNNVRRDEFLGFWNSEGSSGRLTFEYSWFICLRSCFRAREGPMIPSNRRVKGLCLEKGTRATIEKRRLHQTKPVRKVLNPDHQIPFFLFFLSFFFFLSLSLRRLLAFRVVSIGMLSRIINFVFQQESWSYTLRFIPDIDKKKRKVSVRNMNNLVVYLLFVIGKPEQIFGENDIRRKIHKQEIGIEKHSANNRRRKRKRNFPCRQFSNSRKVDKREKAPKECLVKEKRRIKKTQRQKRRLSLEREQSADP